MTVQAAAPARTLAAAEIVPEIGRANSRPSAWGVIRRQRLAVTGLVIVAFFGVMAVVGPFVAPHGATEQFSQHRLEAPSGDFPFGTDEYGRDILTRLLHGARISFQVGTIVVLFAGVVGVILGLLAGYLGGWIDNVISLVVDVVYAFPAVLLAIAIITILGNTLTNAMIAIALVYMPPFVRIVRGAAITVRNTAYVEAARSLGAPTGRILLRHVLPNITAPLIVQTSLAFAQAALSEAGLAFLGLGNKAPAPSWGSMVSSSYGFLQLAPWAAIFPGAAIALTVLGFNLLGDGLRDALDPRLRSIRG